MVVKYAIGIIIDTFVNLKSTYLVEVNAGIVAQDANSGHLIEGFIVRGLGLSTIDETEKKEKIFKYKHSE